MFIEQLTKIASGFGDSESCQVNVNCSPEGDNWQDVKEQFAELALKLEIIAIGSGSFINNTEQNCIPYVLI